MNDSRHPQQSNVSKNHFSVYRRAAVCLVCILSTICLLIFTKQQQAQNWSLLASNSNDNSLRAMQLAVMARRAAATGQRASAGLLPTARFETGSQLASDASQNPQLGNKQTIGNELNSEATGASYALSGALSAFHGAALPQPTANVAQDSQLKTDSSDDKLFKIMNAPSSTSDLPSPTGQLKSFHESLFKLFTAHSPADKKVPSSLSLATVNDVISTDEDLKSSKAPSKAGLSAFHDRMFQLFTSPDSASNSAPSSNKVALRSKSHTGRIQELSEEAFGATQHATTRDPALAEADKGFFDLWRNAGGATKTQKPEAVSHDKEDSDTSQVDPVLRVAVDKYGIPIEGTKAAKEDTYGLPDGGAAVPV